MCRYNITRAPEWTFRDLLGDDTAHLPYSCTCTQNNFHINTEENCRHTRKNCIKDLKSLKNKNKFKYSSYVFCEGIGSNCYVAPACM